LTDFSDQNRLQLFDLERDAASLLRDVSWSVGPRLISKRNRVVQLRDRRRVDEDGTNV